MMHLTLYLHLPYLYSYSYNLFPLHQSYIPYIPYIPFSFHFSFHFSFQFQFQSASSLYHLSFILKTSKPQQQPPIPIKSQKDSGNQDIHFYSLQYPNALFLEFLLLLLSSHAAQELSIKLSPVTLWSAGLIILVNAGLLVSLSLRGETCACTTRIGSWLCRCVAQTRAPFGEYFQMAEFRTVRMMRNYPSLSVAYLEP